MTGNGVLEEAWRAPAHLLLLGDQERTAGLRKMLIGRGYRVTACLAHRAGGLLEGLRFDATLVVGMAPVDVGSSLVITCREGMALDVVLERLDSALARSPRRSPMVLAVGRGEVWFDVATLGLRVRNQPRSLTSIEARMLRTLAVHPFTPVCRSMLRPGVSARAVDASIMRLRRRLEPDPDAPVFVRTVRNRGYMLTPETLVHPEW